MPKGTTATAAVRGFPQRRDRGRIVSEARPRRREGDRQMGVSAKEDTPCTSLGAFGEGVSFRPGGRPGSPATVQGWGSRPRPRAPGGLPRRVAAEAGGLPPKTPDSPAFSAVPAQRTVCRFGSSELEKLVHLFQLFGCAQCCMDEAPGYIGEVEADPRRLRRAGVQPQPVVVTGSARSR